jgi:hypothetical protein
MGASTYTYTELNREIYGNRKIVRGKYAITAYGTDGIPITPAVFKVDIVDQVLGVVLDVACKVAEGAVQGIWDHSAQAIYFLRAKDTLCAAGALVITVYVTVLGS